MTSLCPGTVFQSSGLNHHSTPCPPSATPADIDKQLSRKPFNGRDWPRDSPVARVYDVGNSSTKLVLLNRRLKKHSRLRGLTDFNGDILAPSPDRHMSEEPAVNKQHHETCCNSSSERFHPQISLDLSWKNSTQRPPSTFNNGSHVNQNRHISCRVPRDQPLDELYRRRPYTSASMHSDLGCLWPVLADPDLSFGERRYLYSVACIYNVNPMKQTKQEQYYQLLYKELMKGYQPSEVHQRYLHYLTSPRKTQFGRLDPEKRAKSAPPPPPTLPVEHGQTTTTRVTSSRTTSRMSKRSHANAKSVTSSSSSRPSSISSHPSTSSNKRSKSVSSRSQSASTVKSGSSQQLTANEVKHKESNDRDVVQADHKNIPHVGDDQGKLTRNEEQDHGNKPRSNDGSPPEREESNENERNEKSPRIITVVSEDIKPSTATHMNRDDLDKKEGDRGRENGSFSSTGSKSNHHDKQSHSPSFFPDGKKTSDKEHEASHDQESTDEEVITTIHRTQSYEQGRHSNTHTEEKRSTHSRPSTGDSQGKEYMAPNRLAKSTSQGSSLNENNQPLNESQAQDENPLVTVNQTDQGGDSDDALPEFSTQERNHDVDKIEY